MALQALLLADTRRERRGMRWTTARMRSNSLKRMSRTTTTIAEVHEAAVAEGWEAQEGVLESAEIHNSIVTFLTPKTVTRNLGDNLWISPLNSLNLNTNALSAQLIVVSFN
jgi:hypothetical protein